MVCPCDRGVLFGTAGTEDSERKSKKGIIYQDSLSQDNTNVLNSNEKIPAQLYRDTLISYGFTGN